MTLDVAPEALVDLFRLTDRKPYLKIAQACGERTPWELLARFPKVFALWPDENEPDGYGLMVIEGFEFYRPATHDIGVFVCRDRAEATAWLLRRHPEIAASSA